MLANYMKLKGAEPIEIDLRHDTAIESDVLSGKTFHKADGSIGTGTATLGSVNPYNDVVDNQYPGEEYQGQQYPGSRGAYLFASFNGDNTAFANYYTPELKAKIQTVKGMFYEASLLTSIDLSDILTHYQYLDGLDCDDTFAYTQSLQTLNFSNTIFDYETYHKVITSARRMFYYTGLPSIDLRAVRIGEGTLVDLTEMFYLAYQAQSIQFNQAYTIRPKHARSMFNNAQSLTALDLSNINWDNVYEMDLLFYACISLQSVTLDSSFMYGARNSQKIFGRCDSLTDIYLNGTKMSWKNGDYYGIFNDAQITQTIIVHCTDGTFTYTWNVDHYDVMESADPLISGYYIENNRTDSFYLDAQNETITMAGQTYAYVRNGNTLSVTTLGDMYIIQANQVIEYNHNYYNYYAQLYTLQDGTYAGSNGTSSFIIDSANTQATDENGNTYTYTYGSGDNTIIINNVVYWLWGDNAFSNNNVQPPIFFEKQVQYTLTDGQYMLDAGSDAGSPAYFIIDNYNQTATDDQNNVYNYTTGFNTITIDGVTYTLYRDNMFESSSPKRSYSLYIPPYTLSDGTYVNFNNNSTWTFDSTQYTATDENGNVYNYSLHDNDLEINHVGYYTLIDNNVFSDNNSGVEYYLQSLVLYPADGTYNSSNGVSSWTFDTSNQTATDENGNTYGYYMVLPSVFSIGHDFYEMMGDNTQFYNQNDSSVVYTLQSAPSVIYHLQDGTYNRTQGSGGSAYYIIDTTNSTATNSNSQTRSYVDNNDSTFTMDKGSTYETYYLDSDYQFHNKAGNIVYTMTPAQ